MRVALAVFGVVAIVAYAVLGAFIMNDWAVVAASGRPLDETIAAMRAAGEPYRTTPGFLFAILGVILALAWGLLVLHPLIRLPVWAAVIFWGIILAFGAPAYFFAAFANLNSVGDVFSDWDAEAAFAVEAPLYAVSGVAVLVVIAAAGAAAIAAVVRGVVRRRRADRGVPAA